MKAIVTLAFFGLVCGLLLTLTNLLTREDIQTNREREARAILIELVGDVLPENYTNNAFGDCDATRLYRLASRGYAGEIEWLVAVRQHQEQSAVSPQLSLRVERHQETPGIGDFIDQRRNPWITQFDGSPPATFTEFDNASGATVTSRAVRRAAELAITQYEADCVYR